MPTPADQGRGSRGPQRVTPKAKSAVRALLDSETRLRALFEGMLDPVLTIDDTGIVQEASRSVAEVFGYPPAELVGRNISILMPEPHRSAHDGYLARYRETGKTWILGTTREFEVVRKDGESILCELSVARVDVAGAAPLFVGSFRDVTARKRADLALAESERRFRAIFDQEFQFVGLLKPDGRVIEMNRAALEAAGVEREEVLDLPFWETPFWSTAGARERVERAVAEAASGSFVRFEADFQSHGERRTVDLSIKPVLGDDGEVAQLLPEGRDITPFKQLANRENALLRSLASIGEAASDLAHEIKNPITAINLALRAVADQLHEDQRVVLEELVGRMEKLERTVRRMLDFARPLTCRRDPVEPRVLIEEVRKLLAPRVEVAELSLETNVEDGCRTIVGDQLLLEQVLSNLVGNAIDATEAAGSGKRIVVSARSSGDGVVLRVEDDGPGIPPELRTDLFKPFTTGKPSGTGLGLALSRKIVEAHAGRIELTAGELGGAAFEVELPGGDASRPRGESEGA